MVISGLNPFTDVVADALPSLSFAGHVTMDGVRVGVGRLARPYPSRTSTGKNRQASPGALTRPLIGAPGCPRARSTKSTAVILSGTCPRSVPKPRESFIPVSRPRARRAVPVFRIPVEGGPHWCDCPRIVSLYFCRLPLANDFKISQLSILPAISFPKQADIGIRFTSDVCIS